MNDASKPLAIVAGVAILSLAVAFIAFLTLVWGKSNIVLPSVSVSPSPSPSTLTPAQAFKKTLATQFFESSSQPSSLEKGAQLRPQIYPLTTNRTSAASAERPAIAYGLFQSIYFNNTDVKNILYVSYDRGIIFKIINPQTSHSIVADPPDRIQLDLGTVLVYASASGTTYEVVEIPVELTNAVSA